MFTDEGAQLILWTGANGKLELQKIRLVKVIYKSLDEAYNAEKMLLEKTELNTSDVEQIRNPTEFVKHKRNIKVKKFNGFKTLNKSSSDEEIPTLPVRSVVTSKHNQVDELCDERTNSSAGDATNSVSVNIASTEGVSILQNIIAMTNVKIDNLIKTVEAQNVKLEMLTKLILDLGKKNTHATQLIEYLTFSHIELPLQTIDSIKNLEEKLKEEKVVNEFKGFLLQLGGNNLKTTIKTIIQKLYTLELQTKINYSGREGKFGTNNLLQTQIIIEVIQRNSDKTATQAIEEYMYHLQHVTDRIRSSNKAAEKAKRNL
ncbi:hypothetical protein RN001_005750 [Aquatica leii]|uniref:DUF4806 domain-containing protein n=1 Tax=Aquatica leii TaxID=1421715 RepID=A0AAN7PHG5_9COLE|nr:hypothetical protein RN001_005750 [Aquatica leii]